MTRIAVSEDYGRIFAGFIYTLTVVDKHPWMPQGPLADVPDVLFERIANHPELAQLSGQKHPLEELGTSDPQLTKAIEEAEIIFKHLWSERAGEVADRVAFMKQMLDEFSSDLDKRIEEVTGVPWPYDEVWLVPAMYAGGTVTHNIVLAGFPPKPGHIDGYVHELIHINTRLRKRDLKGKLHLPKDANEMTTVLLTNRVIKSINSEHDMDLAYNKFAGYQHKIANLLPDLERMAEEQQGYGQLVIKVDEYLSDQGITAGLSEAEFHK